MTKRFKRFKKMVKDEFGLTVVKKEKSKSQIDSEIAKMFDDIWKEKIDTDKVEYVDFSDIKVPKSNIDKDFIFDNKEN